MIIFRIKEFSQKEDKINSELLKEAKKRGIKSHVLSDNEIPRGAEAYYVPKKGFSGRLLKKIRDLSDKNKWDGFDDFKKTVNPGDIHVKKNAEPFVIGHEIGHGVNERNFFRHIPKSQLTSIGIKTGAFAGGFKKGKSDKKEDQNKGSAIGAASIIAGNLQTPIDEHLASQYSLKQLKKLKADEKYIKNSKKWANGNTLAYFNPKEISRNKIVRQKVAGPLFVNGSLYAGGYLAGKIKKKKDKN